MEPAMTLSRNPAAATLERYTIAAIPESDRHGRPRDLRSGTACFGKAPARRSPSMSSTPKVTEHKEGVRMPYIEVKAVDRRFDDPAVAERLIVALTDAACEVFGEDARQQIWVVVDAVPAQRWGIGGKPLS
jgi:4-oxalocrotonate tautomerase